MKPELQDQVHGIYEVVSFKFGEPYTLQIEFDDGVQRTIDFRDVLEGELYGPLKDPKVFLQAKLEEGNLVWPNGADFDPEILHDWPQRREAMVAAAAEWRKGPLPYHFWDILWAISIGFGIGLLTKVVLHTHGRIIQMALLGSLGASIGWIIIWSLSFWLKPVARQERIHAIYATVLGGILMPLLVSAFFASH